MPICSWASSICLALCFNSENSFNSSGDKDWKDWFKKNYLLFKRLWLIKSIKWLINQSMKSVDYIIRFTTASINKSSDGNQLTQGF